jgi:hypothetical protein
MADLSARQLSSVSMAALPARQLCLHASYEIIKGQIWFFLPVTYFFLVVLLCFWQFSSHLQIKIIVFRFLFQNY